MTDEDAKPLSRADQRWLLGSEYARIARGPSRRTVARTSRWSQAKQQLPRPGTHGAGQHVDLVFYGLIHVRLEKEGWRGFAIGICKQEQWWYDAVCLLLAQGYADEHAATCKTCTAADWAWLTSRAPRLPKGIELDITGNTKPPSPPSAAKTMTDPTTRTPEEKS